MRGSVLSTSHVELCRGVLLISPLPFVLTLGPLLQRILQSHRVLGLSLPGAGTVAVTAYAGGVTSYFGDADGVGAAFQLFEEQGGTPK